MPLTVPEVQRLLLALSEPAERFGFRVAWSGWRRRHQAVAKRSHTARRNRQEPTVLAGVPDASPAATRSLVLTEPRWTRVAPLLPPQKPRRGRPALDHRAILDGMLGVVRTGRAWRELPERFGDWQTIYSRYRRWRTLGLWEQILTAMQQPATDSDVSL